MSSAKDNDKNIEMFVGDLFAVIEVADRNLSNWHQAIFGWASVRGNTFQLTYANRPNWCGCASGGVPT